ncbi:MAG: hypothetical protein LC634_07335 [Sphingomonadales bacterium]|nr:hypothetical protein [Sphingomonadales bacterium]
MDFLKTVFWVVVSALVVIMSINNWTPVTLNMWSGLQADVKLPVLLIVIFLIGFLPTMIYYRTKQWRLMRRLDTMEREVSDLRGIKQFQTPERPSELTAVSPAPAPGTETDPAPEVTAPPGAETDPEPTPARAPGAETDPRPESPS